MLSSTSQVQIDGQARWCIYRRLRDLDVSCSCRPYQPLCVSVDTPISLLQVWSVTRQYQNSRRELANWLETCWQQRE